MTPAARLWPFRSPGLGPKGTVKGRQGQENGTGALSPGLLLELHVPRLFPEGCGQRCTLANQKFIFLESQPKVDWANGDPVGGGPGRTGFVGTSPRMICAFCQQNKKSISHPHLVESLNVFWMEFCFFCMQPIPSFEVGCFAIRMQFHFLFLEVLACVNLSGHSHKY